MYNNVTIQVQILKDIYIVIQCTGMRIHVCIFKLNTMHTLHSDM